MHVYQLSSMLEKYDCNLIDMSDDNELKEKFNAKKYFVLLTEESNWKEMVGGDVTKVIVLKAEESYEEATILEMIKNTTDNV